MTIQEAEIVLEERQEIRQIVSNVENEPVNNEKSKPGLGSDSEIDLVEHQGAETEALAADFREDVQDAAPQKSDVVEIANVADDGIVTSVIEKVVGVQVVIAGNVEPSIVGTKVIPQAEKKSLGSIKDTYFQKFRKLERVQNQKLDGMLLAALKEYEVLTANEQFNRSVFIDKYQTMGQQQEKLADQAFYQVYQQMQRELVKNGYLATEADPFKNVYEATKEQRRSSMFSVLP